MTTDVTEIINAISNALGIAYNKAIDLYPSVVKMNIVYNIFSFLAGIIFCVLAYWFLYGNYKRVVHKIKQERHIDFNYCDYVNIDFCGVLVFIGAVCTMIGIAVCLMSACDLITWIIAPDIMSVQWVVDLMK